MATWSTAQINALPDSAFACVNGNGRHYPHHDASGAVDMPHLRAAMSRIGDMSNEQCGKAHLMSHEKAVGMGKALLPVKAQPMDNDELDAWFAGETPRRILSLPFGGPIPSPKSSLGVDLDGEWFSDRTDIYGPYAELRQTRERLADWHHAFAPPTSKHGDPTGMMRGHILGKSILDPEPESDGWWSDFWFKAGEKRTALIRQLMERGAQLFGSSQPAPKGVMVDESGEILVWPHWLQTLTTSPQNTLSVVTAKAVLNDSEVAISPALRSVLDSLDNLSDDLAPTRGAGDGTAKAGRESLERGFRALDESLSSWQLK